MPIGFRATGIDVLTPQSRKLPVIDRPQALRFVLKVLIAYGGLSPGSMVDVTHAKNGPWDFTVPGKSPAKAPFVMAVTHVGEDAHWVPCDRASILTVV